MTLVSEDWEPAENIYKIIYEARADLDCPVCGNVLNSLHEIPFV